jgi:diadenosine tetraphosphate (Ap4A) HIT family hydrolase
MEKLRKDERNDFEKILFYSIKKLHTIYRNISIIYKEGNKKEVGKSIDHMHYHLIPDMQIDKINNKRRNIFSEKKYEKMINNFRKRFIVKDRNFS